MKKVVFKNGIYKLIRTVGATAVIEDADGRIMVPASALEEIPDEPKTEPKEEQKPKKKTRRKTSRKKGAAK